MFRYPPAPRAGESAYWNPKIETLERQQLDALQLAKLRRQVAWAPGSQPVVQAHAAPASTSRT